MSKVFLIGKVSMLPLIDIVNNFHAAKQYLHNRAFEVVNPIEHNHMVLVNNNLSEYLRTDIKLMMDCFSVALLPDWDQCEVSKTMADLAKALNFNMIFLTTNIYSK
jgi:hypothetical protein